MDKVNKLIEIEKNMPNIKLHLTILIKTIINWWLPKLAICTCMLFLGLLLGVALSAYAVETPIPPAPVRWVTDTNNFISVQSANNLDGHLKEYERVTGHQLLVYINQTTGGLPIEDWSVRTFATWKVGRKGIDDGLVLFIMSEDHQIRIEVGYGLEGQVTDVEAARIINEVIAPRIKVGDHDGAILAGINAIVHVIGGQGLSDSQPPPQLKQKPVSIWQIIIFGIVGILFLILLVTHPSLAFFLIANILSGNRRDGSGGGFGGGGGRSGGGGASGSW